jgi:hypothetical protein
MKKYYLTLIIALFVSSLLANAVIIDWVAEPEQGKVILTWKTSSEDDVEKFVIERSNDNRHYKDIGEVASRGPGFEYRFEDNDLGMTSSIFYYRLRVVNKDKSVQYSEPAPAIPNISNISRSWGSIKALFQ